MKIAALLLISTLFGAHSAQAATRWLVCKDDAGRGRFSARLDDAGFAPGSGGFRVTHAEINELYAHAGLTCVGPELGDLACVGFWNKDRNLVVKVTLERVDGRLQAVHRQLEGSLNGNTSPWPCTEAR